MPSLVQRILRIGGRTEWEAPWYRWVLRIGDATSCDVVDEAEIGSADFTASSLTLSHGPSRSKGTSPLRSPSMCAA